MYASLLAFLLTGAHVNCSANDTNNVFSCLRIYVFLFEKLRTNRCILGSEVLSGQRENDLLNNIDGKGSEGITTLRKVTEI